MAETGEQEETFADAKEGQGIEGVVGFEAHGKVVRRIFQEPETEGYDSAGESPDAPCRGVRSRLAVIGLQHHERGRKGGGGQGKEKHGGPEPEGKTS